MLSPFGTDTHQVRLEHLRRASPGHLVLLGGAAIIALHYAFPIGSTAQMAMYQLAGILCAVVIAFGVRRYRPDRSLHWWLLCAGAFLWTVGDAIFSAYPLVLDRAPPFPSVADAPYLLGYVATIAAIWVLVSRRGRLKVGDGLDVLLIFVAGALVMWSAIIRPSTAGVHLLSSSGLLSVAYPTFDLLIVVGLAQLLFAPGQRGRSFVALAAGCALLFVTDAIYTITSLNGTYVAGSWLDAGWLIRYTLLAAAATYPSMRDLHHVGPLTRAKAPTGRLLVLPVATVGAMAVFVAEAHDRTSELTIFAGASMAMFSLVFIRMALLFRETATVKAAASEAEAGRVAAVRLQAERQEFARELAQSEERFRTTFEGAPIGMLLTAPDGSFLRVNHALSRMLGLEEEELLARDWSAITHPEDFGPGAALFTRLQALEIPRYALEKRLRRADGSFVDARVDVEAVFDSSGAITHVIAQIQDVSELNRVENELRENQRLHRLVLESAGDLIALLDLRGRVQLSSRSSLEILGFTPEELKGRSFVDLVHPDDMGMIRAAFKTTSETGSPAPASARIIRKDGEERTIEGKIALAVADGGTAEYFAVSLRDVTERAHLEDQLRQIQKTEAIGRLAGGVAHDFNNLLTGISGYCDLGLAALNGGNENATESLTEIRHAAEQAAGLTQQLLAFGRKQALSPEVLDLNEILSEDGSMLQRLLGHDIAVETRLESTLGAVLADRTQVGQVLMNLAVNARDAMPDGGRLVLETENVELAEPASTYAGVEPGSYVRLTVSDDGVGMTPEVREKIFDPFFTTKDLGRGTGLGLSTVQGIVQQSKGGMTVDSEPGAGTTFTIYLPAVNATPAPRKESAATITPGSGTILVVEDEAIVRRLMRKVLESAGYTVVEADHPARALEIARGDTPIDLVVTDVVMPEMNGAELALRIHEHRPQLRVLYTSGYTRGAVSERGVIALGDEFLQKPYSNRALTDKISTLLAAA
jgi:PAS domain S-box-containing protein